MADITPAPDSSAPDHVPFGFRDVPRDDKNGLVRGVFDSVSRHYDIMNDVMSGGLHRLWKNAMVRRLRARPRRAHADRLVQVRAVVHRVPRPTDRSTEPARQVQIRRHIAARRPVPTDRSTKPARQIQIRRHVVWTLPSWMSWNLPRHGALPPLHFVQRKVYHLSLKPARARAEHAETGHSCGLGGGLLPWRETDATEAVLHKRAPDGTAAPHRLWTCL